jgi:uncharacterized OB-fold protein
MMSERYKKPLPRIDEVNRPYWEAARRHELLLQKCQECGHYRYPPGETCPFCLSDRLEWVKANGRGTVYTWTVFHQVYHPAFEKNIPYAVVAVELDEGPRLLTNLVNCKIEAINIGMPVEVVFDDVTEEVTLPQFRPISQ